MDLGNKVFAFTFLLKLKQIISSKALLKMNPGNKTFFTSMNCFNIFHMKKPV